MSPKSYNRNFTLNPADGAGVALHVPAPHCHCVPFLETEHPLLLLWPLKLSPSLSVHCGAVIGLGLFHVHWFKKKTTGLE